MGGVASMMSIPKDPWKEFSISVVGPFFNFALAAILYFPMLHILGRENMFSPSLESWPRTFANVFWVNPVLGAFNLIPAFPMDGGRIFRSLLSLRLNYIRATRISVILGQFFAILFFLLGVWKNHWMLVLVGFYVYFAASGEMRRTLREDQVEIANDRDHELS
jgi:Zn-dependent protease